MSSGAEDHMVDVASWMKEHGHEPVFLITTGSVLSRQLVEIGVPFHPVFDKSRKLSLPLRIGKAVLAERPDVISINREHNILPVVYSTRLASHRLARKPKMVAVFHTPTGRYYPGLRRFDGRYATVRGWNWCRRPGRRKYRRRRCGSPEPRRSSILSFAAVAGRYAVSVAVTDSASGRVARSAAEVVAFGAPPRMSDLLLGTGIRTAGPAYTAADGEWRKGNVLIAASQRPMLTPQQASLAYYLELYAERAESVTIALRVLRADGSLVIAPAVQRMARDAGGAVARGSIGLAGLPPGCYRARLRASRGWSWRRGC